MHLVSEASRKGFEIVPSLSSFSFSGFSFFSEKKFASAKSFHFFPASFSFADRTVKIKFSYDSPHVSCRNLNGVCTSDFVSEQRVSFIFTRTALSETIVTFLRFPIYLDTWLRLTCSFFSFFWCKIPQIPPTRTELNDRFAVKSALQWRREEELEIF